jgi:hypothetical protein
MQGLPSVEEPQVIPGIGNHLEERANNLTVVDLVAVGTGLIAFGVDAAADVAGVQAVGKFHPLGAAAGTVDAFGGDGGTLVHDAPFGGDLLAHFVIIGDGGFPGIACFTVDAAAGNQDTHNDQIFYVNSKEMNPD